MQRARADHEILITEVRSASDALRLAVRETYMLIGASKQKPARSDSAGAEATKPYQNPEPPEDASALLQGGQSFRRD